MRDFGKLNDLSPKNTFFTADPHFFHEGIIGHCDRPFANAQEMNEAIIRNWNAVVPAAGTVIVLGDMFWKGDLEACERITRRLKGKKYLVAGNHDKFPRETYLNLGFEDATDYLEFHLEGRLVVCSHYPILEWNGFYRGSWHLHGHVHGKGSHFSKRVLDVGVDCHNFTPLRWREVERKLADGMRLDEETMRAKGNTSRHMPWDFDK